MMKFVHNYTLSLTMRVAMHKSINVGMYREMDIISGAERRLFVVKKLVVDDLLQIVLGLYT